MRCLVRVACTSGLHVGGSGPCQSGMYWARTASSQAALSPSVCEHGCQHWNLMLRVVTGNPVNRFRGLKVDSGIHCVHHANRLLDEVGHDKRHTLPAAPVKCLVHDFQQAFVGQALVG